MLVESSDCGHFTRTFSIMQFDLTKVYVGHKNPHRVPARACVAVAGGMTTLITIGKRLYGDSRINASCLKLMQNLETLQTIISDTGFRHLKFSVRVSFTISNCIRGFRFQKLTETTTGKLFALLEGATNISPVRIEMVVLVMTWLAPCIAQKIIPRPLSL